MVDESSRRKWHQKWHQTNRGYLHSGLIVPTLREWKIESLVALNASLHEGLVFSSNCAAPDLRNMYSKYFSHFNHDAAVAIENKQRKRKKELAALKTRLAEG
ncbi:hypothetical protein BofuT4_P013040.1 [Botrytis cinerea T4]|uniref:Uncharacterized protein n=1 Tax=Botryotinia fuckeliana (strain T4) TaxID=999810 RepID=G2XR27_BOTF4|nr:hypothetical protein BofuT4_P013040.1 [Botrytis cinerea T4]